MCAYINMYVPTRVCLWFRLWLRVCARRCTTIGYGDMSPQQPLVRMLTIPYSVLGIVAVAMLGREMGDVRSPRWLPAHPSLLISFQSTY